MRPYQLKRNILYSAIQGKLVSQVISEGTGEELLKENIKTISSLPDLEKKKIGKTCKPIGESDILFDIPDSWAWERFGNLVINYDSQRKPVTKSDRKSTHGLYDYYGATGAIDRVDEYIFDGEYLMIGEDGGNFFVDRDNSFVARGAFWANNHVHVVKPIVCDIGYLKACLDAYDLPNMGLINGIAVPKLNQENMNSIMIPVPPLAEQKRIVAKIEELLPLIDRYEKAWSRLEEFNKQFPGDLQKSILQMAIQGKLVEQRPEEGTGEELYQQIQAEKQKLIAEGKIKKEKPLPEITEDEKPFDIPDNWTWVKLGNMLLSVVAGKSIRCNETSPKEDEPGIVKVSAVTWGRFQENESKSCISGNDWVAEYQIQEGDFLISRANTKKLVGACVIVEQIQKRLMLSDKILRLTFYEKLDLYFVLYAIRSNYLREQIESVATGTSDSMKNISQSNIMNLVFPLPPLAEQKRIVARLEELLPLCDALKS